MQIDRLLSHPGNLTSSMGSALGRHFSVLGQGGSGEGVTLEVGIA